jgi:hypothetical protein
MFNFRKSFKKLFLYRKQKDFVSKIITSSFPVLGLSITIRYQVCETNLLQLIPGFFFIFLFFCFIFLIIFSDSAFLLAKSRKIELGTKTVEKIFYIISLKFCIVFLFTGLFLSFLFILPLSLESLNNYSEQNFESLWSFLELLIIEIFLAFLIIVLSQVSTILSFFFTTQNKIIILPRIWKIICFLTFLVSGLITPTIDGYTQISFSFFTLFLYCFFLNFLQKRVNSKFFETSSITF